MMQFLGVRGIVAAVAIAACGVLYWRLDSAQETIVQLKADKKVLEEANKSNTIAIGRLIAANVEWEKKCKADPEKSAQEVRELAAKVVVLHANLVQERRLRKEAADADPGCDALLRSPVCPALAERMRRDGSTD